ncbi:MAG: hypothetical protein ACT4QC_00385 [Planctomycetaceae bacterium]
MTLRLFDPLTVFRNDSGEQVPAFGVLRLTGVAVLEPARVVLTAQKPDTYGCQYQCAINGPTPVPAGKYGVCTRLGLLPALYDAADGTPAFGERWGPRSGTWKLKKHTGGFRVLGVTNGGKGLALVEHQPFLRFRGVTDEAIASGADGVVSIYYGSNNSYTDTTVNMSDVANDLDEDIESGATVECVWEEDTGGNKFKIIQADWECP